MRPVRLSKAFVPTLKEAPADAQVASHKLLVRAGFIRQLGAGIYDYLPLARRSLAKIEAIVREEMDAIGGQEFFLPALHPAEIWKESGRWDVMGDNMFRLKDRKGGDYGLGMTHEEIFTAIARDELRSYRQLPQVWYQIQTKFRDEPRPKSGLLRVRQFTMKDAYSFDVDRAGLDRSYEDQRQRLRADLHPLRPRVRRGAGALRRDGRLRVLRVHGAHRRRRGPRRGLPEVPLRREHRDRDLAARGRAGRRRPREARAVRRPRASSPSTRSRRSPTASPRSGSSRRSSTSPTRSRWWPWSAATRS